MKKYNPQEIEPKWQKIWEETNLYQANLEDKKEKFIGFGMFNYPSGAGIHVGHVRNYTIPDVITRYKRQQGYNVYQPVGWDSFGLPAENYAIKTGVSPQESIKKAIEKYQKQYRAMGWGVDWTKEIDTTDPSYYKWTQWIFAQLFEHDLAYQKESAQWWCDKCKTVLADEQVVNGKCWRHEGADDPVVTKRNLKQWFFKITEYADEILEATDSLNWTPSVKASQKSWIGKSNGAQISFAVENSDEKIQVFTTRADTLFGATFIVLAPEHELVKKLTTQDQKSEVDKYQHQASHKTDVERQEAKEKTGVFTGTYAINPINNEKIPVWVADYVLMGYGTGAIMAVPAHDERDNEFACKYDLPIITVIEPETGEPQKDPEYRRSIVALLRNPKDNTLLSINWGKHGGNIFIGGGVDDAEDLVEAAKREIAEETGYTDVKFIEQTENVHHNYYAHSKGVARRILATGLLFDLIDDTKSEQNLEKDEQGKFTIDWLTVEQADKVIKDELHRFVLDKFIHELIYTGYGELTNSDKYDGLDSETAKKKIVTDLEDKGLAQAVTNYKMRDWLISRQRYWGAPIPIIHCSEHGAVLVPESDLPVVLPSIKDYKPTGGNVSVLAGVDDWVNVTCPTCGKPAKRETDTMDGYVCSSWYFLRYLSANDSTQAWDPQLAKVWMPVDFYNGGAHATAHLLYARFFMRFFNKLGLVSTPEPFEKMVYNGLIKDADGSAFSKTLGNGQDPLEIIESGLGADALRVYEMFAAPLELPVFWDPQGTAGAYKYLTRVWNLIQEYIATNKSLTNAEIGTIILQSAHKTIKKVSNDLDSHKYNTAIAAMMEMTNVLYKQLQQHGIQRSSEWKFALESLLSLLAPFAPHITEELWSQMGHNETIHHDSWPQYDPELVKDDVITIVVQVNGKLKGEFLVTAGTSNEELENQARDLDIKQQWTAKKKIIKTIVVPNRLVNFVVK